MDKLRGSLNCVKGHRWKVSSYLFSMACLPEKIPSGATKTASSVNSAATAAASLLVNASSCFVASTPNSSSALGISDKIVLLGYSCISRIFLLGKGRQSKADCQPYEGNW